MIATPAFCAPLAFAMPLALAWPTLLSALALPLAAYLMGAIPVGVIIAHAKGIDLRQRGSGNVGATNVGRVLGRKWGYLCFLLDVAKGLLPVLAAGFILRRHHQPLTTLQQVLWLSVALGAVLGHVFSLFLRFHGGKGVATSLGVVLGFWPYFTLPGLAAFALWIAVTLIWRYVSLGSVVAAGAFPLLFLATARLAGWTVSDMLPLLTFAILMALLVILRHRANLRRLLRGQENKIARRRGG